MAFLDELLKSIEKSAKNITQLISDKELRNVLEAAKKTCTKWDYSKQSWDKLEAESPSKKK